MNNPRMKPLFAASALLLATMLPLQAHAHRTWLLPSSSQAEGREPTVTIDAAVSENLFDFEGRALDLDGLVITGPDGAQVQPQNVFKGKLRSSFDVPLSQPGTYKIAIVTESMMAFYKLNGENKRWRGAPEAFATAIPRDAQDVRSTRLHNRLETFASSGTPNDAVFKTSGVGLELVPVTNPTELFEKEKAIFRLLLDGKPAAKLGVSAVPGGVRYRGVLNEIRMETDVNGEFSITWPNAGMYWITASYPPRAAPAPGPQGQQAAPPERRVSYGGTVEVLPQ